MPATCLFPTAISNSLTTNYGIHIKSSNSIHIPCSQKKNKKNLSIYFFEINSILQKLDISIKPVKKLTINNQEKQQILTKHATFLQ